MLFTIAFAILTSVLHTEALVAKRVPTSTVITAPQTGGDENALKRRDPNMLGIAIAASSVYVEDSATRMTLLEKNADEPRSIASITKLMTALVFLDHHIPWDTDVEIIEDDRRPGGFIALFPGDHIALEDLFAGSLAPSANNATAALARLTGLSNEAFVAAMNAKATEIGLTHAHFVDPTGLDALNVASARDVVRLARVAFADPHIQAALRTWHRPVTIRSENGERHIVVKNTNKLLATFLNKPPYTFIGGKTGFIDEAGWCMVGEVAGPRNRSAIGVVLGTGGNEARYAELKKALWWAIEQYD